MLEFLLIRQTGKLWMLEFLPIRQTGKLWMLKFLLIRQTGKLWMLEFLPIRQTGKLWMFVFVCPGFLELDYLDTFLKESVKSFLCDVHLLKVAEMSLGTAH